MWIYPKALIYSFNWKKKKNKNTTETSDIFSVIYNFNQLMGTANE